MKKKALTVAFISVLLFSVVAGVNIKVARANFVPPPANTIMTIETPQNTTYNVNTIILNFTVESNLGLHYFYSLDGQERMPIDNITTISEELLPDWANWWDGKTPIYRKTSIGTCVLSNLSEGWHNLTVYQIYPLSPEAPQDGNVVYSANAKFLVSNSTDIPPSILILSPETKVYNTTDISLNFTVDEPVSQIKYSLDGQDNVTVVGNTTLTDLLKGEHNVTVYAMDSGGNVGKSKTITFTIAEEPEPKPEAFPTTLAAIASGASVAIIGVGLLVFFKKRNHKP